MTLETGYLAIPIFDLEVTPDLIEQCRSDARERARLEGATFAEDVPFCELRITLPSRDVVRCLQFEMTRENPK